LAHGASWADEPIRSTTGIRFDKPAEIVRIDQDFAAVKAWSDAVRLQEERFRQAEP